MRNFIRLMKNEEGATAIEYGLIASLIAVAIVGVLATLGPKLSGVFTTVQSNL
jgi:pilus assembly protein Flp/PilA